MSGTMGESATNGTSQAAADHAAKLREQASKLGHEAADTARRIGNEGLGKASSAMSGLAKSAHDLGDRVGHTGDETRAKVGEFAHKAGERLDSYANKLRDKDIDDVVSDVRESVRRNPAIAVGAAVAIGFLLSRLFRSDR